MPDRDRSETLLRQRKVLADFGDVALQSEDLDAVLAEACRLVSAALGTGRAKVLEIERGRQTLFVRAGVGWAAGVVGQLRLSMKEHSSETFAIEAGEPVVTQDIAREDRFDVPDFMKDEGVVALVNVPIFLPGRRAYGLLQVDDTEPRDFDQDDIEFLRTYATILGPVIDRLFKLRDLRATEERFGAFVTASNDVVYRMSPDWREMRELQGRGLLAEMPRPTGNWREHYVHPEDRDRVHAAVDEAIRTQGLFEMEHRVRHPEGRTAWVLSRAVPIKDADGHIVEWLGAARDVTARREAEKALREREGRLQSVLGGMGEAFGLMDRDFRILIFNEAALRLETRPLSEIVGRSHWEVYPGSEDSEIGRRFKRALAEQQPVSLEHRYTWQDGTARWLEMRAYPVPEGLAVFWHDISERKEAEAERLSLALQNAEILESISDAFYAVDRDWRFTYVNRETERWWGRSREELLGRVYWEEFPQAVGSEPYKAHRRAAETREVVRLESVSPILGHWVDISIFPTPDGGLSVYFRDITDKKKAEAERLRSEAALRESEERFRAIVETATDYAIFTTDAEGRIAIWPKGTQEVFGWSAEEAVGQPMEITYTPEDRAADVPAKERQTAQEEGHAPNVRWHLRKDGARVFIDGVARPLTNPDGTVTGFVKVGQDVTERRATEEALRESEARFRQFGEASSDVLWIRNCESLAYEYLSPAYETVYGLPREEALRGNQVFRWVELVHPEDREKVLDLLRRVRAGENATETYRVIRPSDGQTRWIRNTDFPLRDADGRVQRIGGLSHDTTEEIEARERLEMLVTELQHRTRNLIGVVSSIANQTMAHTGPTEAFREEFNHRMAALSRVQGLLSRAQVEPITLHALLRLELDALGAKEGETVRLEGPAVRIRPTIVQTLALVIHELATNARKYGALSGRGGRLSVMWRLHQVEGQRQVHIEWREEELPPTQTGPSSAAERGGGYGRRLIERALPYSLGAQTTYELGDAELRCTIDLPLDREPQGR
ncbi:PAS domain S-box protein [Rubellimicrobium arenae]|uniref:PAS domain S-box protein n=1 Tax=Rubellimicrobium arenae TaxID=2817372 RepID=UPI001B301594|nr:PAS domain S-box protein [Rubellimicrobium arenae]